MQIGTSVHRYIGTSAQVWVLTLLVIITRIPFLFDGYGHEEDSYGLVVNAFDMVRGNCYSASRFPGHPFQEYIYSFIWRQPDWVWNSLSTIFSVVGVVAFYKALKKTGINYAFEVTLMLAFTPMFFVAGTYSIDYTWSLAFVLLSFWALVNQRFWLCGILLGMAVGCRITSGIFIIPWALLLYQRLDFDLWKKWLLKILIPFGAISILWYMPAFSRYGMEFFDYSDQFPYPPFTKITYKATIGVFGILGLLALTFALFKWLFMKDKRAINPPTIFSPQRMTWVIVIIIVLHIISYLRLPQKAGYMLPIVPFVLMLIAMYSTKKTIRILTVLFILSPFLLGMSITDELRGSGTTAASVKFNISGQEISIDALRGPVLAEQQKRRNKMEYVKRVCNYLDTTKENFILICGWWYNEIYTEELKAHGYVDDSFGDWYDYGYKLSFYSKCEDLLYYVINEDDRPGNRNTKIYYLPEQDLYNDQMFGQHCTNEIAEPFPVR